MSPQFLCFLPLVHSLYQQLCHSSCLFHLIASFSYSSGSLCAGKGGGWACLSVFSPLTWGTLSPFEEGPLQKSQNPSMRRGIQVFWILSAQDDSIHFSAEIKISVIPVPLPLQGLLRSSKSLWTSCPNPLFQGPLRDQTGSFQTSKSTSSSCKPFGPP